MAVEVHSSPELARDLHGELTVVTEIAPCLRERLPHLPEDLLLAQNDRMEARSYLGQVGECRVTNVRKIRDAAAFRFGIRLYPLTAGHDDVAPMRMCYGVLKGRDFVTGPTGGIPAAGAQIPSSSRRSSHVHRSWHVGPSAATIFATREHIHY